MQENLSVCLSETIRTAHEAAIHAAGSAREHIEDALGRAADVGLLVEQAKSVHHGRFPQWLRENVPSLPVEQAEAYFGIHRVRKKRQSLEIDHRQLKLIGIIGDDGLEEQGGSSTAQRADHSRWVKWAGHVVAYFREAEAKRPLSQWEEFERRALADQLDPIVRLWERAKGLDIRKS